MITKKYLFSVVLTGLCFLPFMMYAQVKKDIENNTFYVNVNEAGPKEIFQVQDEVLGLQYNDRHGNSDHLMLDLFNWKREKIGSYQLFKSFGINYFEVNIKSAYDLIKMGENFSGKLEDESGKKYELHFKKIPPVQLEGPEIDIFVNPISTDCEGPSPFLVEFYGSIRGGKAPFKVHWYVMNKDKNALLNQPLAETIKRPGKTTVIQVGSKPEYYVLLNVEDGCGNEVQRVVHMTCKELPKKINTVFLENLPSNTGIREIP